MNLAIPRKLKNGLIYISVALILLFNFICLKSAILGLILGMLWVGYTSIILGKTVFPSKPLIYQNLLGFFVLQIIIILLACACFYLIGFYNYVIIFIFLFISAFIVYLNYKHPLPYSDFIINSFTIIKSIKIDINKLLLLFILYLILYFTEFYILITRATVESIRSPWEVMPKLFFIIYFTLTAILILIILKKNNRQITSYESRVASYDPSAPLIFFISLHAFLSLSIALIIYKVGFGFDPFVHRASETALANLGYILPKPLYYLGQYTLVVFWSKILLVKISLIDKLLVPLLASCLLPAIIYYSLRKILKDKKLLLIVLTYGLLLIVYCFFFSVPQSLSNLFLLILVFLAFESKRIWLNIPIALTIFLIHPFSGIPAFILVGFIILKKLKIKKIFKIIYSFLASISIPLFFLIISRISNNFNIEFNFTNLTNFTNLANLLPRYLPHYSIYHQIYLFKYNLIIIFIVLFIAGIYYFKKNYNNCLPLAAYRLPLILLINFILLNAISFNSVINYEQSDFPRRLLGIMWLCSLPVILCGFYFILQKIIQFKSGKLITVVSIAFISTITLYLSYPRVDAFDKNRGYSVSSYDIEATRWINQDAGGSDYVVLANQSVSAAALQEFGFKKYYDINQKIGNWKLPASPKMASRGGEIGNLFYYPIPTSSPLYDIYLKMVYDGPSFDYINQARQLTGVNTVYFLINDYWLDSAKRVKQAKLIADDSANIEDKIYIFKFE